MKKILAILFLGSVLLFATCKKDSNNASDPVITPTSTTAIIRLTGTVVDETGAAISGATVTVGGVSKGSDNNGFFVFENVTVPSKRYYVSVSKSGFFESGYGGIPKNGGSNSVRIQMNALGNANLISGANGGVVSTTSGATVTFQSNSFETFSGLPITGAVSIYTRYLSPADPTFAAQIPGGDLACAAAPDEISPLISYGMLGVTILDQSGIKLRLISGKTAEIKIPIAATQLASAPATIPLLSFDPVNGIWNQEGVAVKTGNYYIGTVSHFSWWNCDVITSYPAPTITGKVLDCNGIPMPGIVVTVNNQFTDITNSQGTYSNWVPSGTALTLQVQNAMNSGMVLSSPIVNFNPGPGNNIVPDLIVPCPAYISGNVVDCSFNSTYFYAWASWTNGSTVATFSQNGSFQMIVPPSQYLTIHLSNGQYTYDTTLTSGPVPVNMNIGAIPLCNNSGNTSGCSGGPSQAIDIDGNVYNVVQIGNQCWMKENLKTSRYQNGDSVEYLPRTPIVADSVWNSRTTGVYTVIDNNLYGKLYNWYAVVDQRELCPTGWHVPDSLEMVQLSLFLGGDGIAGGKMKTTGTIQGGTGLWYQPNTGATNVSGFTGLPAGVRAGGTGGDGGLTYYWLTNEGNAVSGWVRELFQNDAVFSPQGISKSAGCSVRCIRD